MDFGLECRFFLADLVIKLLDFFLFVLQLNLFGCQLIEIDGPIIFQDPIFIPLRLQLLHHAIHLHLHRLRLLLQPMYRVILLLRLFVPLLGLGAEHLVPGAAIVHVTFEVRVFELEELILLLILVPAILQLLHAHCVLVVYLEEGLAPIILLPRLNVILGFRLILKLPLKLLVHPQVVNLFTFKSQITKLRHRRGNVFPGARHFRRERLNGPLKVQVGHVFAVVTLVHFYL